VPVTGPHSEKGERWQLQGNQEDFNVLNVTHNIGHASYKRGRLWQ
jgi:hypothetical protein